MNDATSPRTTAEPSTRYIDEVLLQPAQVDDVCLGDAKAAFGQEGPEHPHGDY